MSSLTYTTKSFKKEDDIQLHPKQINLNIILIKKKSYLKWSH